MVTVTKSAAAIYAEDPVQRGELTTYHSEVEAAIDANAVALAGLPAFGGAAALDAGVTIGDLVQLVDDGGGNPALPAVSAALLTGLPSIGGPTEIPEIDLVGQHTVDIATGLPATTHKIELRFRNLSTTAVGSQPIVQIGSVADGGFKVTAGDYVGNSITYGTATLNTSNINTGMMLFTHTYGNTYFDMTLNREANGLHWHATHQGRLQAGLNGGGHSLCDLAGALDRIRVTLTNTAETFDSTSLVSGRYWS